MKMCNKCNEMIPPHRTYEIVLCFSSCPDSILCFECWEQLQNNIRLSKEATINAFFGRAKTPIRLKL